MVDDIVYGFGITLLCIKNIRVRIIPHRENPVISCNLVVVTMKRTDMIIQNIVLNSIESKSGNMIDFPV